MKEMMIVGRYQFVVSENNTQHSIPKGLLVQRMIEKKKKQPSYENNSENTGARACHTGKAKTCKVGWWSTKTQKTQAVQPVRFWTIHSVSLDFNFLNEKGLNN